MQRLSPYQAKISNLVALGYSNRDIAEELKTSEQAVKSALHTIFDKLGVGNRVELVGRLGNSHQGNGNQGNGHQGRDQAAALSRSEEGRLETLRQYVSDAAATQEELDDVVHVAATLCETPIALLTIVESDRVWLKSAVGMQARDVARAGTICDRVIQGSSLVQIKDATKDERFADQSYVRSEPHVCFYAAVPLLTPDGYALGALCVIDHSPRELTLIQQQGLTRLARLAQKLVMMKAQRSIEMSLRPNGSAKADHLHKFPAKFGVLSRG
ncbi:MAG TPA: LuxR C-terminal-related transcriptional regulator [Terriglobales bacterium]|nr:LuxR C-terminal-related transcriptional regulator [Terriglobales bacterium]